VSVKNKKAKGSRAELKTIKYLEPLGYSCTKSGGSLGCWDVIAISEFQTLLIQVKCNRWVSGLELEELKEFKCPSNHVKQMWRWDDHKRAPRVRNITGEKDESC